jgi:hypothetical protein
MSAGEHLIRLHAWAVGRPALRIFTVIVRALLALAFMPSGLVKVQGHPFTLLPTSDPVGFFFAGFFSALGYYRFIGVMQILAAVLLLVPATATLGALIYLPIIANIFAITVGVNFEGTRVVTGLMLLADVYLLCWDYDRWKSVLPIVGASRQDVRVRHLGLGPIVLIEAAAALGLFGITGVHLARLRHRRYAGPLLLVAIAALGGVTGLVSAYRQTARRPAPSLPPPPRPDSSA